MIQASDNYSKIFGHLQTKSFKEQIRERLAEIGFGSGVVEV